MTFLHSKKTKAGLRVKVPELCWCHNLLWFDNVGRDLPSFINLLFFYYAQHYQKN